jgi:hypothetical protein
VVQAETEEGAVEETSLKEAKRRIDEKHRSRERRLLCSVFRLFAERHRILSGPNKLETLVERFFIAALNDGSSGESGFVASILALAGTDHIAWCVRRAAFHSGRSVSGHTAGSYHLTLNTMGKSQKPAAEKAVRLDVFNEVVRGMEVQQNFIGTGIFHPEKGLVFDLNLQIQRIKDNPGSKARTVQSVIERGEGTKPYWEHVGTAFENKNNPDNLTLRLCLRSKVKKDA